MYNIEEEEWFVDDVLGKNVDLILIFFRGNEKKVCKTKSSLSSLYIVRCNGRC